MKMIDQSIRDRPRIALKPHCGHEVVVTVATYLCTTPDQDFRRYGRPVWKLDRIEVNGVDERVPHVHVKMDDPPLVKRGECVRFRAKVMKYIRRDGSEDWSFDGRTVHDVEVLRGGRWVIPEWPVAADDDEEEPAFVPPPCPPPDPPKPSMSPVEMLRLAKSVKALAGDMDGLERAQQLSSLADRAAGGWDELRELLTELG